MDYLQSIMAEIEPCAKSPIHTPPEHHQRVFQGIAITMILTTIVYLSTWPLANKAFDEKDRDAKRRLCYQITNMSTNSVLGLLGIYFEYRLLPSNPTMENKIQGFHDYYVFSSIQIGYQFWSFLVGLFLIHERIEMMFHHVSVICVASMAGFLNNGFRYWTPYFFGIYELSSVPLGVMNIFKDNRKWMDAYPKTFANVRAVFAVSFLTIRIVMLIPRLVYLRDIFLLPYLMDPEHWGYRLYFFAVWFSSSFLCSLQFYWGSLVVSGIVKNFGKSKPKKKES